MRELKLKSGSLFYGGSATYKNSSLGSSKYLVCATLIDFATSTRNRLLFGYNAYAFECSQGDIMSKCLYLPVILEFEVLVSRQS